MTLSEYEDFCDSNLSTRRVDISTLMQLLQLKTLSSKEIEILKKNFIVFLYSNWQWYIDESTKEYLNYVNFHCWKWICLLETEFKTWNLKINILKDQYFKRIKLDMQDFFCRCTSELRFNGVDIKKINNNYSTDFSNINNFQKTIQYVIDVLLVWLRNDIAHWKKIIILPSIDQIKVLVDFIFKILEKYKEFLVANIDTKSYLVV